MGKKKPLAGAGGAAVLEGRGSDSADVCSSTASDSNFFTCCEKRSTPRVHTSSTSSVSPAENSRAACHFALM